MISPTTPPKPTLKHYYIGHPEYYRTAISTNKFRAKWKAANDYADAKKLSLDQFVSLLDRTVVVEIPEYDSEGWGASIGEA